MKIGNKEYKDLNSDCWLVFPGGTLTINVHSIESNTYLITELIYLTEPELLFESNFQLNFEIKEIINIDSTLIENDKALEIFNQIVVFNEPYLFKFNKVRIQGNTLGKRLVQVEIKTSFRGFEILKMDDYINNLNRIESCLKKLAVEYSIIDEIENDLIRIKIKTID